jgi:hypothetical protein
MKRIALLAAVLTLGAGAAMAAAPGEAGPAPSAQHHHQKARVLRTSAADRETQALNLLEAKGYGSFANLRPVGKGYTATVTQGGHTMNVRIDPQSGVITTES